MRILTLLLLAFTVAALQERPERAVALVGGTVVDVSAFGHPRPTSATPP